MAKYSPMMEQYLAIKAEHQDCLLFFRLGDFYELFFNDALLASAELELTLTGRDCGQDARAPMCGVPYHSADNYIARLIQKGYKVAICEQTEDPKSTKTIVKREVVRIVTPGTVLDSNMLDENKNNYIACIYEDKLGYGIAVSDISTGEFLTTSIIFEKAINKDNKLIDELARYNPSEIVTNNSFSNKFTLENIFNIKPDVFSEWAFFPQNAHKKICDHFKVHNLSGYGIENDKLEICASGALLQYLYETQKNSLLNITSVKKYSIENFMVLDISSRRNLELTESIRDKTKKHSLLWVLDKTKTAMGARLIRKWVEQPLINAEDINKRLDFVTELKNEPLIREELKEILNTVYDIERITGKIVYKTANARDLINLKNSLEHLPHIKTILRNFTSVLSKDMHNNFDILNDIYSLIETTISEDPPVSLKEGGLIKAGYNAELEKYREAKTNGTIWLSELETKEKEQTGIKNLKIRYNKIFGYCIEITNSNKDQAPARYVRRQTLSNCERYTTEELKDIEEAILGADEKMTALEYELFKEILDKLNAQIPRMQLSTAIISTIDVIQSFADVADKNNYEKPIVDNSDVISISEGRHPVIEMVSQNSFVPNDTYMDTNDNRLAIITGPNMAGKSTYMRQVALIVLMAQIGSFVPAESCHVGIVDRIFTRVGASDDLATGQSTFMVEMSEVANILNNASKKSLIILDEIGRGTSTFDGLSIAWSVLEYIVDEKKIGARTLFATHYHEITELEGKVLGVNNFCITVAEHGEDIIFLRKIARGGADHSYGIQVAKLAGLPIEVLKRAREILNALNNADIAKKPKLALDEVDVVYYGEIDRRKAFADLLLKEIMDMDLEGLSARDALNLLYTFKVKTQEMGFDSNDE